MKQSSVRANKTDRLVQFRLQDAQRIANVVHIVESERRGRLPSRLPRAAGSGGGEGVVFAKFTGAWAKSELKRVVLAANTNETTMARNILFNVSPYTSGSRYCALGGSPLTLLKVECVE